MTYKTNPIQLFSVRDFGLSIQHFLTQTKPLFEALPFDCYDSRKEQIQFLQTNLAEPPPRDLLFRYYLGEIEIHSLATCIETLSPDKLNEFKKIQAYRKRAVSRFILDKENMSWRCKRIPTSAFSQDFGKIDKDVFDIRLLPRQFTEIEEAMVDNELFKTLLFGVASNVAQLHPSLKRLDITVHHVRVMTSSERITSNAPEGIHQDGFDYIVSALVVERENVLGGESQIFKEDKKTKIFTTTLQPGFGILQPDKGTDLWHTVTPITVQSGTSGYRSSIGFDIALEIS